MLAASKRYCVLKSPQLNATTAVRANHVCSQAGNYPHKQRAQLETWTSSWSKGPGRQLDTLDQAKDRGFIIFKEHPSG